MGKRLLSLAVAALLVLTGCAGSSAPKTSAPASGSGGAPQAAPDPEQAKIAAARKEGKVSWYMAYAPEIGEDVANRFEKKYGIKVTIYRAAIEEIMGKFLTEAKAGSILVDVMSGATVPVGLKKGGYIEPYVSPNINNIPQETLGGLAYEKEGTFTPTSVIYSVIAYNPKVVKDPPKKWTDLLDPKWKGQIVHTDPKRSGTGVSSVVARQKLYGWEYFDKLAANKPLIVTGRGEIIKMVGSGERPIAGESNSDGTWLAKNQGENVEIVWPEDGAVVNPFTAWIAKGAKNPNAARLLIDFLISPENQEALAKFGFIPLTPGGKPPAGMPGVEQIKVIRQDWYALDETKQSIQDGFWARIGK